MPHSHFDSSAGGAARGRPAARGRATGSRPAVGAGKRGAVHGYRLVFQNRSKYKPTQLAELSTNMRWIMADYERNTSNSIGPFGEADLGPGLGVRI